jgi:hypothetical protein
MIHAILEFLFTGDASQGRSFGHKKHNWDFVALPLY